MPEPLSLTLIPQQLLLMSQYSVAPYTNQQKCVAPYTILIAFCPLLPIICVAVYISAMKKEEVEMLTPRQFAAKHGVAYTTVMKWLYAELLKGAVKQSSPFGEGYYYKIPANCPRPTRKPGLAKGTKLKRKSSGKKTAK
jgi:hypothetical protein